METTRPNFMMPARKVEASRRFGFLPKAVMGITAARDTRTARSGFMEVLVSMEDIILLALPTSSCW
jgi:hypothetical protein